MAFTFRSKKVPKAFEKGKYKGDEKRTCALYNLVIQADLVFDGWKECGYLLASGPKGEPGHGNIGETNGHAVISAPPNNTACTPDRMNTEPCKSEWTRTLARNHESLLMGCMKRIRGVSQTCRSFDRCGPHFRVPTAQDEEDKKFKFRSICHTAKVGYFKEPAIERMCGVCDMYKATVKLSFKSPKAGFKKDSFKDPGGDAWSAASGPAGRGLPLAVACLAVVLGLVLRPAQA